MKHGCSGKKLDYMAEILGSHSAEYEVDSLLGYSTTFNKTTGGC
jgi:hypothetical protein